MRPTRVTTPASAASAPIRIFSSVLLPEPFSPTRPTTSPACNVRSAPRSTGTLRRSGQSPRPNDFLMPTATRRSACSPGASRPTGAGARWASASRETALVVTARPLGTDMTVPRLGRPRHCLPDPGFDRGHRGRAAWAESVYTGCVGGPFVGVTGRDLAFLGSGKTPVDVDQDGEHHEGGDGGPLQQEPDHDGQEP